VDPVLVVTVYQHGDAFHEYYRQVEKKRILFAAFIPILSQHENKYQQIFYPLTANSIFNFTCFQGLQASFCETE
jgi:hypothetical protein